MDDNKVAFVKAAQGKHAATPATPLEATYHKLRLISDSFAAGQVYRRDDIQRELGVAVTEARQAAIFDNQRRVLEADQLAFERDMTASYSRTHLMLIETRTKLSEAARRAEELEHTLWWLRVAHLTAGLVVLGIMARVYFS